MADLARQVGERIRAIRKVRRWTQEELASRAGLHYTYVGAVERGEKNLTLKSLHRLAGTLGIPMPDLLKEAAHVREPAATYGSREPCEFEMLLQRYPPRVKRQALELLQTALKLSRK